MKMWKKKKMTRLRDITKSYINDVLLNEDTIGDNQVEIIVKYITSAKILLNKLEYAVREGNIDLARLSASSLSDIANNINKDVGVIEDFQEEMEEEIEEELSEELPEEEEELDVSAEIDKEELKWN